MFWWKNTASVKVYFFGAFFCDSQMYFFSHPFSRSHFRAASAPFISLCLLPLFMLYLSHPLRVPGSSTSPCGAGVGRRRWGWRWRWAGEAGVWASSGGGAWPPVCLGAPNESMIHGTGGSHRDRIRGALSNRSPERGKRYLICPPRRQLPLCVRACVCVF